MFGLVGIQKIWWHDISFNVYNKMAHIPPPPPPSKHRHSLYLNSKNELLRVTLIPIKNDMHVWSEYAAVYKLYTNI